MDANMQFRNIVFKYCVHMLQVLSFLSELISAKVYKLSNLKTKKGIDSVYFDRTRLVILKSEE
jgi:hypothetical protein